MLPGPADLETTEYLRALALRSAKKDLDSTSTLFPFLEKTEIKLKDDHRQGRTIRDRN